MKLEPLIIGLTTLSALHAQAQQADKAELYRGMLLKRPENTVLFGRFVDAWLTTGEMAGLKDLLETKAADGGAMDWRLLAVFRNFSGDEAGAIQALDEALKKSPDDASTRLARAKALGAALRFEDAMADLEVAEKNPAVAVEAGTLRGKFLARAGRPADAVKAWLEVIAAHPGDEGLREDLIELEIGEGMLAEAVTAAKELADKTEDPYQKALRRMRVAEILAQAGKKEDSVKEYSEVFAVSAEASWLEREVLARVNALFAREDDATGLRAFYSRLRETYPRRVVVKKEAARSLMAAGEGDEAVAMFREVLKVTPGDRDTRDEFIALLEGAGRFKDAADEVAALLSTADKDAALWEKLAGIRRAMGDETGLKEAVDKAVALAPEGETGSIAAAAIYERYDRPDDAEKILRAAVKSHGLAGEVGEALAVMLANRGKQDDAVSLWQEMAKTADREGLLRISRSLTAHGRAADAYTILATRMSEFDGDPLLLAALCQAAQFSEQSDNAIPLAMELVKQAKNPSDLEAALRQAMALISRSEEPRTRLDALAAKPNPSTQELCLLAEMYESLGDSIQADKTLKLALAGGDPLLAAAQRVRLFEIRGDLSSAINATRDWLALPGGLRTEQVKRLVSLYEKSGDLDAALKETENWKRIAPGDKLAWQKRSELFTANGQADEAVAELRRALAKFGTDEEMRAKLATSLSEAGLFDESWQMFYSLYDEADSATSKLKWVGSLAEMAASEGKEEQLIADFKRRSRDNPSSVVPLLAMAEMYRTWLLTEEESQAIEEASRRKPDDVSLLQRLAGIQEKNGAGDKVEALLNRAIRIQDSPENRRQLAAYWIRTGEAERGLTEMLANGGGDPRDIEKLVNSLAIAKDWEAAAKILASEVPKTPDDWRLNYLYANVLRQNGQTDEAFRRFASLLDAKGDLAAVTPLIPANQLKWMSQGSEGASNFTLFAYLGRIAKAKENQRNWNFSYGNQPPGVPLPGDVSEVHWMALSQALEIADETPDTRDAKLAELKSAELPDLDLIKSVHALGGKELRDRLLADDADPRLFRWYLETLNYNSNPYQNNRMDFELMRKGVDRCLESDPELALNLMVRMPTSGDEALGPERTNQMVELITALAPKKRGNYFHALLGVAFAKDGAVAQETREKAEAFLLAHIEEPDAKQPSQTYFKYSLASSLLRAGRIEESVAILNAIYQDSKNPATKAKQNGVMTPNGMISYQQMFGNRSYGEFKFPDVMRQFVNQMLQGEFYPSDRNGEQTITPDQKKLLKLLGEEDNTNPYQGWQQPPVDAKFLVKAIPSINDPILRLFMAQCADKKDLVASEVKALEEIQDADSDALQIAAAYRLTERKDPAAAYRILVRARKSANGPAREMIDWNLYSIGLKLVAESPDKVDLEDARRAALRLRKPMSIQEDQKRQLAVGMTKLGLEEESKRYTAAPKGINGRQSPYRGMSSSNRRQSSEQAIATLVSEGKREMAARRILAELRLLSSTANSNSNYQEQQLVSNISSLKLEDEVMQAALPPEGASFKARRDYAMLLARLKKDEASLPLLRQLAAEKPDDFEVRTALLLVLPKEEQKDFLLTLSGGDFDTDRLGTWFNSLLERGGNSEIETFLTNVGLLVLFLEKLPPSFDSERNLSWVNFLAKDIFENVNFGKIQIRSLTGSPDLSEKFDEARTKERNALAIRLYQAMLRHPQTSEQGFILMHNRRTALAISRETLDSFALSAFSLATRLAEDTELQNRYGSNREQLLWMWRRGNGGGSSRGGSPSGSLDPLSYLMRNSSEAGGVDPYNAEFLASLEKDAPEQAKSIKQSLSIVDSPGIAAFNGWKETAKTDPSLVSRQLPAIVRIASFRKRTDILDAALGFTCDQLVRNPSGNYNVLPGASEVFAMIIASGKDMPARKSAIERITTGLLGPREAWDLYGSRNQEQNIYQIQIRMSAFQQLAQSLRNDPQSAVPFARFVAANQLANIGEIELRSSLNTQQMRADPAAMVKNWIEYGLLAPGADLAGSTQNEGGALIEQLENDINNYGNDESKKALGDILLKVEGPDRFWARFLGAKVAKTPDVAVAELNANAKAILKWSETSRGDLARVVTRWFPDAEKKANPTIKRLLSESLRKGDAKIRGMAQIYLKDGFPNNLQPYSIDQTISTMIRRLIAEDPALAAQVWEKLLEHLKQQNNGWNSTNNGYSQTAGQYVNRQFAQSFDRKILTLPMLAQFAFELEKRSPGAGSGMFAQDASYYIQQIVSGSRSYGNAAFSKDKSLESLDASARTFAGMLASMSRDTPKEVRPVLAALFLSSDNSWSINSKALPGLRDWIRKDLKKIDAHMSDSALLMLAPQDEKEITDTDKSAMRKGYIKLLTDPSIPAELRVSAEFNLSNRKPAGIWESDPACFKALTELMLLATSDPLEWSSSNVTKRFTRFADLKLLDPADAMKVLSAIKANPPDFSQYGTSSPEASLNKVMVAFAVRGGDSEAILREVKAAENSLRGDLAFAIRLWQTGQNVAANSLIARPGEYHSGLRVRFSNRESNNRQLPVFNREIESNMSQWLAGIEDPGQRYRVECLISSMPDAKDDQAPQVKHDERIKGLVNRFAAEAPKTRVSRSEVLAVLGSDDASSSELFDEKVEAIGKQKLGTQLVLRDGNSENQSTQDVSFLTETLIRDVIQTSIERDCDAAFLLDQLKSIQPTSSGNQKYYAREMINGMAPKYSAMLIHGIIDLPAEKRPLPASQALEIATALLENDDREIQQTAVALAICSQAAARNGAALDTWLAALPKPLQDSYAKCRKDSGLNGLMSRLKSYYQSKKVSENSRRALLAAILEDPATMTREIQHMTDITSIMESGTFSKDDVVAVIDALPENHTRRAEFLSEKAGIIGWHGGTEEEALKAYDAATAAAAGDEEMLNYIKVYRVMYLDNCLNRPEDAQVIAKTIQMDGLAEREKKFMEGILKKYAPKEQKKK